jgi:hypothetical protein
VRSLDSQPSASSRINRPLNCAVYQDGWTALVEAVRGGHTESMKLLIQRGADIHATTEVSAEEIMPTIAHVTDAWMLGILCEEQENDSALGC